MGPLIGAPGLTLTVKENLWSTAPQSPCKMSEQICIAVIVGCVRMMNVIDATFFSTTPRHTTGEKGVTRPQMVVAELVRASSVAPA